MTTLYQRVQRARRKLAELEAQLKDQDYTMPGGDDAVCRSCFPQACDDPDMHLGAPTAYTPLTNRGCHCGADYDGRDCMCFEDT
jgi:hypothetical protein